jgi:hypothetical protein
MSHYSLAFQMTTFDFVTKVVIPVSTFILGVVATLLLKQMEQRRMGFRTRVEEIADQVNNWYNQLHAIDVEIEAGVDARVLKSKVYDYVRNRLVMPKLVRNLEVIRHDRKSRQLVLEVEGFLKMVTNYNPDIGFREDMTCAGALFGLASGDGAEAMGARYLSAARSGRMSDPDGERRKGSIKPTVEYDWERGLNVKAFRVFMANLDRSLKRVVAESAKLLG